jgi:putative restriction endonuclease
MTADAVKWNREHTLAALHLYLTLPFGRLSRRTPEVEQLASWEGRSASSVAMKLVNFASLDPEIVASGRAGLSGATNQDRMVWSELHSNWDRVATEAAAAYGVLASQHAGTADSVLLRHDEESAPAVEEGRTRESIIQARIGQLRFRKMVLASYNDTCCMSGLRQPELLVASHIIPWSEDKKQRLNPHNGLCLSALHDRAFDRGLITVLPNWTIAVSSKLGKMPDASPLAQMISSLAGQRIIRPDRFVPGIEFLQWHARRFGFL